MKSRALINLLYAALVLAELERGNGKAQERHLRIPVQLRGHVKPLLRILVFIFAQKYGGHVETAAKVPWLYAETLVVIVKGMIAHIYHFVELMTASDALRQLWFGILTNLNLVALA